MTPLQQAPASTYPHVISMVVIYFTWPILSNSLSILDIGYASAKMTIFKHLLLPHSCNVPSFFTITAIGANHSLVEGSISPQVSISLSSSNIAWQIQLLHCSHALLLPQKCPALIQEALPQEESPAHGVHLLLNSPPRCCQCLVMPCRHWSLSAVRSREWPVFSSGPPWRTLHAYFLALFWCLVSLLFCLYFLQTGHHQSTRKVSLPQRHLTFVAHWAPGSLVSHPDSLAGFLSQFPFLFRLLLPTSTELELLPAS